MKKIKIISVIISLLILLMFMGYSEFKSRYFKSEIKEQKNDEFVNSFGKNNIEYMGYYYSRGEDPMNIGEMSTRLSCGLIVYYVNELDANYNLEPNIDRFYKIRINEIKNLEEENEKKYKYIFKSWRYIERYVKKYKFIYVNEALHGDYNIRETQTFESQMIPQIIILRRLGCLLNKDLSKGGGELKNKSKYLIRFYPKYFNLFLFNGYMKNIYEGNGRYILYPQRGVIYIIHPQEKRVYKIISNQ